MYCLLGIVARLHAAYWRLALKYFCFFRLVRCIWCLLHPLYALYEIACILGNIYYDGGFHLPYLKSNNPLEARFLFIQSFIHLFIFFFSDLCVMEIRMNPFGWNTSSTLEIRYHLNKAHALLVWICDTFDIFLVVTILCQSPDELSDSFLRRALSSDLPLSHLQV